MAKLQLDAVVGGSCDGGGLAPAGSFWPVETATYTGGGEVVQRPETCRRQKKRQPEQAE
jgi:hypothetical protein